MMEEQNDKAEGSSGRGAVSEDSGGQEAITNMCVLLVEDDAVARKCAEAALRSCGYRVIAAENGREALDILKSKEAEKIDMILTDILMPEVSGLQLLDNVVHSNKWKKLPVTVMSSQDSIDTAAKCIQKGAVEFLAKPVRKHKLSNLWQHVLRRKAASDGSGDEEKTTTMTDDKKQAEVSVNNPNQAMQIPPQLLGGMLPQWANQLPQAIVEIAFKSNEQLSNVKKVTPAGAAAIAATVDPALHHSNSCSAFSAFIRCREGDGGIPSTSGNMMTFGNPAALAGVLPHPLQVSNLNIVQQHSGGFRGSGMLTLQDLSGMRKGNEGATERRAEAIRKFREKKKARTFKKKVRYESRKRLAEARPRIKGQFVRPEVAAAAAAAAAAAGVAAGVAAKAESQQVDNGD
ncbi:response regulator of potential two component system [Chloropicon primus]|uniref:Response regulator of potential two component system n=1 Tax=Chloropicon primus TaxID=1764295 RepID=A0A5B8MZ48_9CHLO|nr:response regulator of potential two component system [Chloropicon primus]UPR04164.1 response regulator of potential two component system [Chloropicon primus]|mmetsp:Transcript_10478/g.29660  ORF Transcript_10478/g.29660 Transcript_10478/m.29660 type:complete len:403 (+) Transcript_10478:295-1503(+)|eukprot:QDZ24955.1 response regulator of potential two component system [Chloropicon primus]